MAGIASVGGSHVGGGSVPSASNLGSATSSTSSGNPFELKVRPMNYGVNHISWNNPSNFFPWTDYKLVRKFGGFATNETLELRVLAKELTNDVATLTLPYSTEINDHMYVIVSDVDSTFNGEYFLLREDAVETVVIETTATGSSGANTITVASTSGLVLGMEVTGTGIGSTAYVTAINTGTGVVTLSVNNTAALSTTDVSFACTKVSYTLDATNVSVASLSPAGSIEIWAYAEVVASGVNDSLFIGVNSLATVTSGFKIDTYTGGGSIVIGDKPGDPEPPERVTDGPLHDDIPRRAPRPGGIDDDDGTLKDSIPYRWDGTFDILQSSTYKDILVDGDMVWNNIDVTFKRLSQNYSNRTLSFKGGFVNPGDVTLNDETKGFITVSQDKETGPVQTITYTDFYSTVPTTHSGIFYNYIWPYSPETVSSAGDGFTIGIAFPPELIVPGAGPGGADLYQGIIYNSNLDLNRYYPGSIRLDSGQNYAINDTLKVDFNSASFSLYKNNRNLFDTAPVFTNISGTVINQVDITISGISVVKETIVQNVTDSIPDKPSKIIDAAGNIFVDYGNTKTLAYGEAERHYKPPVSDGISGSSFTRTITAASRTASETTITLTSTLHGLSVGSNVTISSVDATVNGTYKVTATPTANTFTVTGTATTSLSLTGLTGSLVSGSGYGAKFAVVYKQGPMATLTTLPSDDDVRYQNKGGGYRPRKIEFPTTRVIGIKVIDGGQGYKPGDVITISKNDLTWAYNRYRNLQRELTSLLNLNSLYTDITITVREVKGGEVELVDPVTPITVSESYLNVPSIAPTFTVTNKALTSNVATLTLGSNPTVGPQLIVGSSVTVSGVDATFNGTYTLTAVTSTTISYAKTATDVPSTAVSPVGTVVKVDGSGATFDVYREGLSGSALSVTRVELNNPGSGYTGPSVATVLAEDIGLSSRGAELLIIQCATPVTNSSGISTIKYGDSTLNPTTPLTGADWYTLTAVPSGGSISNSVQYDVTTKEIDTNVAILTLDDTPVFVVGDEVLVEGVDATFNGQYTITAVDTINNTIEYAKTASNTGPTAASGTVELLFKYTDVPALSAFYKGTAIGYGATFDVYRRSTGPIYSVSVNKKGQDYAAQDLLVIPKEYIGYASALRDVYDVVAENHIFDIGRDVSFSPPGLNYTSTFHQGKEVYYSLVVGYPIEKPDLPINYYSGGSTVFYKNDPGDYIYTKEPLADVSAVSVKDYNTVEWLFQNLPQIYSDMDELGHLRNFLQIIAFKIDQFRTEIDFVFNRANPHKTSMKLVNLYLKQLGIDDEAVKTFGLSKRALVNAIKLYKIKGTTRGLRRVISMYGKPPQELTARPLADFEYARNKILDENSAGFEDGFGFWQPSLVTSLGATSPTLGLGYRTDTDVLEYSIAERSETTPYYGVNCGKISNTTASTATRSIIYGPKQVKISALANTYVTTALEPLNFAEVDEYIFDSSKNFEINTQITAVGSNLTFNQPRNPGPPISGGLVYLSNTATDETGILSSYIPVIQTIPYVFEIKAKRDVSNTDTIKVGIIWRNASGTIISYNESGTSAKNASPLNSGNWSTVSITASAPINARYAQPYITASLATTRVFYIDGISFSQPENVLSATRASSVATLTIRNNGGSYAASGSVTIGGVGKDFDGTFTISTASTDADGITTITYSNSSTNYPTASVTNVGFSAVTSTTINKPQELTTYVDFVEDSYTKARSLGVLQSAIKDVQLLSREEDSLQVPILKEEAIYAYKRVSNTVSLLLSYGSTVTFAVGEEITVSGIPSTHSALNGTFTVTGASTVSYSGGTYNTVSYTVAGTDITPENTANIVGFTARVESTKYYSTKLPLTVTLDSATSEEVIRKSGDVTKRSLTSNVATLTIPDHTYIVGDSIQVSNTEINPTVPAGQNYDGTFTVTAVTYNTVSYALTGTDEVETTLTTAGDSKASVYNITYVTNNTDCQFIKAGYVVTVSGTTVSAYNLARQIVMDARYDGSTMRFVVETPTLASTSAATGGTAYFTNGLTDKSEVLPYEITRYTV